MEQCRVLGIGKGTGKGVGRGNGNGAGRGRRMGQAQAQAQAQGTDKVRQAKQFSSGQGLMTSLEVGYFGHILVSVCPTSVDNSGLQRPGRLYYFYY